MQGSKICKLAVRFLQAGQLRITVWEVAEAEEEEVQEDGDNSVDARGDVHGWSQQECWGWPGSGKKWTYSNLNRSLSG